jgi:hypothetical protein
MKTIIKFAALLSLLFFAVACDEMNSLHQADLDRGETVYTGRVDSIKSFPGNNRIRFSWIVNADPRITKTVIYWNSGRDSAVVPLNRTVIDTLTVNTELAIPEGAYVFDFVTKDDENHRSLKVEHVAEIYGDSYASTLPSRDIRVMTPSAGPNLSITWSPVLSGTVLYSTLTYTDYSNPSNPRERIVRIENDETETLLTGIRLDPFSVTTAYMPEGGLDEVITPPRVYVPYIAEQSVLIANDILEFTAARAASVNKLTYGMHTASFQDLYYFINLHELDLSGNIVPLPGLSYTGNGVYDEIGSGDWVPFMRKVGDISAANRQIIQSLLESGQLTKIRYVPNSMGLDDLLEPYVSSGVVELISLPNEVLVPHQFSLNPLVVSTAWNINLVFPATDAPTGAGLQNVYKVTMLAGNGALVFSIPREYEFNLREYKYLKFKIYIPDSDLLHGDYVLYKRIWLRTVNALWNFTGNSSYGQGVIDFGVNNCIISDDDLSKWVDISIDLSPAINAHNRVFVFHIGGEANGAFPTPSDLVYYFANIRFAKQ